MDFPSECSEQFENRLIDKILSAEGNSCVYIDITNTGLSCCLRLNASDKSNLPSAKKTITAPERKP